MGLDCKDLNFEILGNHPIIGYMNLNDFVQRYIEKKQCYVLPVYVSQYTPLYFSGHLQTPLLQVAPFLHGFGLQGSE